VWQPRRGGGASNLSHGTIPKAGAGAASAAGRGDAIAGGGLEVGTGVGSSKMNEEPK